MDKNQYGLFAGIIAAAVLILVGLALYTGSIAGNIGTMTQTLTASNVSFTLPALNTATDLTPCGQKNISAVTIFNATGDVEYPAANYTISQAAGTDGYLSTRVTITGTLDAVDEVGTAAQITCDYEPKGYIADGGARGMALLIPIFFVLLIMFAALNPTIRSGVLEWFGK